MKIPFCILIVFILSLVQAATYGSYEENYENLDEKHHSQADRKHQTTSDHTQSDPKNSHEDEDHARSPSSKNEKATANQSPVPAIHEWKYAYNPPRVNPFYCTGLYIDHPKCPGLSFASNSIQEIKWRANETELPVWKPNIIWRIRVINSTQHNEFIVGGNMTLYTGEDRTGSVLFPLNVTSPCGLYHYHIMVKYNGQPVHCVYESVPFFVCHDSSKKSIYPGPPIWEGRGTSYYSQDPQYGLAYHNPAAAF